MQQHISVNNRNITLYEFKDDTNADKLKLQDDYKVKEKKKEKNSSDKKKETSIQQTNSSTANNIPSFLLSNDTTLEEEELDDEKPVIVNWDQFKKEELKTLETDTKKRRTRYDSDDEKQGSDLDDLPRHNTNNNTTKQQQEETIFRDPTTGKRISKEEYEVKKKNAKSPYDKIHQNDLEWASGLVQKNKSQQSTHSHLTNEEWNKNMNQTLEQIQKQEWKEEDPMAAFLSDDTSSISKSIITGKTKYSPNRYGIRAGKRWDGVDRSNGFETKLVLMKKEKQSAEENYYKYSTEDM